MEEKEKYTREDINYLKTLPRDQLTPKQRGLVNLNPPTVGTVLNPKGKQKGMKNWSTHFQKLMGSETFFKTIVNKMPGEWDNLVDNTPGEVIAAGLIAITSREIMKALSSGRSIDRNTKEAISLINKLGFGEKFVVDTDDSFFHKTVINFNVVPPKHRIDDEYEGQENKIQEAEVMSLGGLEIPNEPVQEIQPIDQNVKQ